MTKPKDRIKIYAVKKQWCSGGLKFSVVEGTAIETREMFINIEPMELRSAMGSSRVAKADYMRSRITVIEDEIRRHKSVLRCYENNVKDKQADIEELEILKMLEESC